MSAHETYYEMVDRFNRGGFGHPPEASVALESTLTANAAPSASCRVWESERTDETNPSYNDLFGDHGDRMFEESSEAAPLSGYDAIFGSKGPANHEPGYAWESAPPPVSSGSAGVSRVWEDSEFSREEWGQVQEAADDQPDPAFDSLFSK